MYASSTSLEFNLNSMPFPRDPLRYCNTQLAACKWTFLRLCMNWLVTLIAYAIFGLVWERKISLRTRCWYISQSIATSFLASLSLWLGFIGVLAGLHANFFVSLRRFITYFYWEIKIPCLECTTLVLRKYFNLPNSLISNSLVKHCLKVCFSFSSFPIAMMLSRYTRRAVTPHESECLINNVWSLEFVYIPCFSSL